MSDSTWTAPEVAKIAGLSYRTLHSWMVRGLVVPSIREAQGSGSPAIFSNNDLVRVCALATLRPWLTPEGLMKALEWMSDELPPMSSPCQCDGSECGGHPAPAERDNTGTEGER